MQTKTLLNKCHPLKRFIYKTIRLVRFQGQESLEVDVIPRKNSATICSGCSRPAPGYDCAPDPRRFQFVPFWGFQVFLLYRMRRVDCSRCGVTVEEVPWANGKTRMTTAYQIFLARWARMLSWKEVAGTFRTSWDNVYTSVERIVAYGLKNRSLEGISAIGVDEVQWRRGHDYLTLVYQIDEGCRRLLYVAEKRTVKSLQGFFHEIGSELSSQIRFVCSDMWQPYLKVIQEKAPQALNILDRFHIVAKLNEAINVIRAAEARKMKQEGKENLLKHTKYCFLKNPENLTPKQKLKLSDVVKHDLKSVRAYYLKDSFQYFWTYKSPYWAEWYLNKWCTRAMRSRLDPIKRFVKTLRRHQPLIMNYFKAKKEFSSGVVEGMNRKVNLVTRKAYGFRTYKVIEMALYHNLGNLPEPKTAHEFF